MAQNRSFGLPLALLLLAGLGSGVAQTTATPPPSRLAGSWSSSPYVILSGSRPASSPNSIDEGVAPANEPLGRMIMLLAPSAAQQQALATELAALQSSSSPLYHHWLTPSRFADSYSVSASDAAAVTAWLTAQGFQVAPLPAGRGWVEFSGTAAQAEQAFHAQIHTETNASGEARAVLVGDISVPSALQPVIAGLVSLDGTVSTPAFTTPLPLAVSAGELGATRSLSGAKALTPQIVAQLVNTQTVIAGGITGGGQSIAIASRSNINPADVAAFRAAFGLPASSSTVGLNVILDGTDPGLTDAQPLATLSASWAGATAPGAQIVLVPAGSTIATDGVDLSLALIVDQQLATTAVAGYSSCEAALSPVHQAFYSALYEQAAAEGIAVIAAAGDSGAAACSLPGGAAPVTTGYGVNALASTPWNTAVGVAAFGSSGPAASMAAWSPAALADPAYAGGGGASTLYKIPGWQPVPAQLPAGVASAGMANRLLPDLSLPTAIDSASNPGLAFCLSGVNTAGTGSSGCTLVRSGGSAASASLFAGIAALIAQQYGAQGNLAPHLYALSARSGIFTDVAQGSARLPCAVGSSGCDSGQIGYSATAGYDLASGLGVPDAQSLVADWAHPEAPPGTGAANVSLSISPTEPNNTYNPAALITLTATVTSGTGGPVPTGTVNFFDQNTGQSLATGTLNASGVAAIAVEGVFEAGSNSIVAQYSGDPVYGAMNSATLTLISQASTTSLTLVPSTTSVSPGQTISVTVTLTVGTPPAPAITPSGVITLNLDGSSVGTQPLAASGGTFTATFPNVTIPTNAVTTHTLQASYPANTDFGASTSGMVTLTVTKISTTLSISTTSLTPPANSSLVVTATINPSVYASADPTGTVAFTLDGTNVGNGTVSAGNPSTATFTIPNITAGTHTLGGSYNGDNTYTGSTATTVTINASKITTTLTLTPASYTPAGNGSLLVTATINPATTGSTNPTGTVNFTLDGASVGSNALTPGNPSTATFTIPSITPGSHTLGGSYNGDTNYAGSTAQTVTINAAKAASVTTLTSTPTPLASATPESLTATVAPANAVNGTVYTLTGTVSFYDGATLLGTATVSGNAATLSGLTFSATAAHTIKAVYSGDANWLASNSNVLSLASTTLLDTVVLTANYSVAPPGVAIILIATVTPAVPPTATGEQNPTGTVVFLNGITVIGSATLVPVANSDASTATLVIQTLPGGQDNLTASYGGDVTYAAELSNLLTITVQNFTITPASTNPPTNLNIVQGAAGSESFVITGGGGFNGTLQITCTAPSQDDMTCTASPQQINPTATVTFVVQTSKTGTISQREAAPALWPRAAGGTALAALFFFVLPFGRRARVFVRNGSRRWMILLLLLVGLAGSGIGCTSSNAVVSFGTPLGVATLKITAAAYIDNAVVSQSIDFTVNVTAP